MTQTGMWIIGYGSLIFKPPPLCAFKVTGYIEGYVRRFWQSSIDHRGTPEAPGRVANLVSLDDLQTHGAFRSKLHCYRVTGAGKKREDFFEYEEHVCDLKEQDLHVWGVAYFVKPEHVDAVRQYLDIREQNGYTVHKVHFHVHDIPENDQDVLDVVSSLPRAENGDLIIESNIYIGTVDNEAFVGPEHIEKTAAVIRNSHGPSGGNFEYLHQLNSAMRTLGPKSRSADPYLEALAHMAASK